MDTTDTTMDTTDTSMDTTDTLDTTINSYVSSLVLSLVDTAVTTSESLSTQLAVEGILGAMVDDVVKEKDSIEPREDPTSSEDDDDDYQVARKARTCEDEYQAAKKWKDKSKERERDEILNKVWPEEDEDEREGPETCIRGMCIHL